MGRILLIEPDRVFAALVEEKLRAAGLEVEVAGDEPQALAAAARRRPETIVLDLDLPMVGGLELMRALGEQLAGSPPPIVALADPLDGPHRVEVLRAGATELLFRPVDLDELTIRVERLSRAGAGDEGMALEGRLDATPLWEVTQFLEQSAKGGQLLVWDRTASGRLRLDGGRVVDAEWEGLRGAEALMAMLGLQQGRFRVVDAPAVSAGGREPLELRKAMMEAAWIEDELAKRRRSLPATGTPLRWTGHEPGDPPEELPEMPVERVVAYLAGHPQARLYDLLSEGWAAPQRVRLAVAWLRERGALETDAASLHRQEFPTTMEIAASEVLDLAVDELAREARDRGFAGSPSHFLVVAEPERWAAVRALVEAVPRSWRPEAVEALGRRLELSHAGSIEIPSREGSVALHFHKLVAGEARARVESIVPVCAGVLVWLDGLVDAPSVWVIKILIMPMGPKTGRK